MKNLTNLKRTISVLVCVLFTTVAFAQDAAKDTVQFCKVSLTNGNVVTGVLISEDSSSFTLDNSSLGTLRVPKSNIESVNLVEIGGDYSFTMSSGKVYRGIVVSQDAHNITILIGSTRMGLMTSGVVDFNPGATKTVKTQTDVDHGSRYLFAPSAIPLKKGEGYYQNIYILMNGVNYGVTDNFSIGGGVIAPIGFFGNMKYGKQIGEKSYVAGGGMIVTTMMGLNFGVGCAFGSYTYGNRTTNATLTLGYGAVMSDGDWMATKRPIVNFSAMVKVVDGLSLVTENYLIPQREYRYSGNNWSNPEISYSYRPQLSAGFRIGGGKHTFDIAGTTVGGDYFYVIPYFAYAFHFQKGDK